MAKLFRFPTFLSPRLADMRRSAMEREVRVAAVNAPVDFNDDRTRYEAEILNVDAVYDRPSQNEVIG